MRKHALKSVTLLALTLLAMFCVPQRAAADNDDPPTRVARLSHVDGSVSFEPGGTDEWVRAVVNRPMTTGDKLWADHDSRAELHIGSARNSLAKQVFSTVRDFRPFLIGHRGKPRCNQSPDAVHTLSIDTQAPGSNQEERSAVREE